VGEVVDADSGVARLNFRNLFGGIVLGQVLRVTHTHGVGLAREDQNGGFFHGVSPCAVLFLYCIIFFQNLQALLKKDVKIFCRFYASVTVPF
jgi:hypothetical protein